MANLLDKNYNWDATAYFRDLLHRNKLAREKGYRFAMVSGLAGLEEYIEQARTATAAVCISEISPGYTEMNNTPHTRRVKTVFMMKRHAINDMKARQACMDEMRELFRQMMSVLFKERTKNELTPVEIHFLEQFEKEQKKLIDTKTGKKQLK